MYADAKRGFLFRFVDPHKRAALRLDEESLFSTTDQVTADKITRDLLRIVPRNSHIIDGTACIGGNTYSFAQHFVRVTAVELHPQRAEFLAHNIDVLGVRNRVTIVQGDICQVLPQLPPHALLFVDPPWGGPEYKQMRKVPLALLPDVPLARACQEWKNYVQYIAVKAPSNFDLAQFLIDTQHDLELVYQNAQLRKMQLIVMRARRPCVADDPITLPSPPTAPDAEAMPCVEPSDTTSTCSFAAVQAPPAPTSSPRPSPSPSVLASCPVDVEPPRTFASWKDVLMFGVVPVVPR